MENFIREELSNFCCKDIENNILSYLIGKCSICKIKYLTDELHEAYSWSYGDKMGICLRCKNEFGFNQCIKCKVLASPIKVFTFLPDLYICDYCVLGDIKEDLTSADLWLA